MQLSDIGYHAPLGKSDHCVITFKHYCYLGYSQPTERYVYHKTHFNSMSRQLVLSNWTEKFIIQNQSNSVDELWNSFKSAIHEIWNKLFQNNLVEFHHGKLRVAKVSYVSDAENVRQAYTKARKKVKAMICKSKREFESIIGIQSNSNPKIFWSHVCSKLKTKTGMEPLLQD